MTEQRRRLIPRSQPEPELDDPFSDVRPYNWGEHFRGERRRVEATLAKRNDGVRIFYPGRVNWLYGGYECGKTWLVLLAVYEVIVAGRVAVVIDHDDVAESWEEKLRALGLSEQQIIEQFLYFPSPSIPLTSVNEGTRNEAFDVLWSAIGDLDVALIVIEGVTQVYSIEGYSTASGQDIRDVNGLLFKYMAERHPTRPAVVVTDHLTKVTYDLSGDVRIMPVDSGQKLPAINGVGLRMTEMVKPTRSVNGQSNTGQLRVFVARDKGGSVIAVAQHEHPNRKQPPIADLYVHVGGNGSLRLEMRPSTTTEAEQHQGDQLSVRDLLGWVKANPGQSASKVQSGLHWKKPRTTDVLDRCLSSKWITTSKRPGDPVTKAHDYQITDEGERWLRAMRHGGSDDGDDDDE